MSANTWYIISLVGYFVAFIGLVISVILYFKLDILDVIGDLTGRTVAREIKNMQQNRNRKGASGVPRSKRYGRTGPVSKTAKSSRTGSKTAGGIKASKTEGPGAPQNNLRRKPKNGTAEIGSGARSPQAQHQTDKLVLHSRTDKLSRDTEELYEDFDPRVEYSRTDKLDLPEEPAKAKGTAVLSSGTEVLSEPELTPAKKNGTQVLAGNATEVLHNGTCLLDETAHGKGTSLLVEEEQTEPVKFSVIRSYIIVHSEESI